MKRTILMFGIMLVSFIRFISAHAGEDSSSHHMMSGAYGWGMMGFFGWLFMILIIVALVLLIVWLVQQIDRNNRRRK